MKYNQTQTAEGGERFINKTPSGQPVGWELTGGPGRESLLRAVPAPPLDRTVPARLRTEYDAAPLMSDRELVQLANDAHRRRAERAHQASQAAYAATHEGRTVFTDLRPAYDAVIAEGLTDEDFDDAQHIQRLKVAERKVAAAESAAKRETERQAARCRVPECGALDLPTRRPVVQLTAPNGPLDSGRSVVLDGPGVVCAECESVIVAEYLATLAAVKLSRRIARADAARTYVAKARPVKR
ncbi:hypothetical protein L5G32_18915 [Gordonia sp. HY002]|uniref:hypothetical protein n=1 Tax=Gordonia zhenghanii TaxID=2911516 RepID=UPI001EF11EC8|nr:hypothetical protein [Gordonia zhenghanii]MCF8572331.1 hypothetical protein [Gordonia zhenghanii]MCF8607309.1 hypothetical protein [Gordonia zhenghanii]